jgi:hypothetical protein
MSEQNKTLLKQLDLAAQQLAFQQREAERQAAIAAKEEDSRKEQRLHDDERRALEVEPFYLFGKGANANGSLIMIVRETKQTGAIEKMRTSSTGVTKNKLNPDSPSGFSLIMPNNQAKVIYVGFKYRTSAGTESKQVFSIDTGTQDHNRAHHVI